MSYFDTSKDFRILMAEKAIVELEKLFNVLKLQKRKEYVRKMKDLYSKVQNLKYSYVAPDGIKALDDFKEIVTSTKKFKEDVRKLDRDAQVIKALYWLEYLESLPELMDRGMISQPYECIKYYRGEIVSIKELDRLWLCGVDCGFKLNIITNSEKFKQGSYAVVAYLPPREFGKYTSEGMFVDLLDGEKGEVSLGEVKNLNLKEVSSIIMDLLKS
ncbi:putative RNA-binding protein containing a C-terminal EMAP domain [Archaeoglobus sulfaticallidus PM70-1]|uniref:Putative RNA-binding protein containing a C-terminal EMAP domain n=1 Tax=Archaeoglobus sulfaticallidus PM70-1 TaxID=387631 RepID=N0BNH7_9EURY|nr:RNA-binding protein [Archaeoglobus sulfaticallidus]AGK62216.1 putative RNA-binding protein containing a C-terminal EMAP domain [Archaeoglobus sulfaticallidus PM70-1]